MGSGSGTEFGSETITKWNTMSRNQIFEAKFLGNHAASNIEKAGFFTFYC
jgi:hypothetical protein